MRTSPSAQPVSPVPNAVNRQDFALPHFRLIAALAALLLTFDALAQGTFTPVDLGTWNIRGDAPTADATRGTISIPAGAQLNRSFTSDEIAVRVVSRPLFSQDLTGLSTLEVGQAILTFTRDEDGGALVLLGDQAVTLPFEIALDADGRSEKALELTLGFNRRQGTANLLFERQQFTLAASAPVGPIEVVVSAGNAAPWSLDSLAVAITGFSESESESGTSDQTSTGERLETATITMDASEAARRRAALADEILRGRLAPEQALAELRVTTIPQWKIHADGVFGLAAIHLGETLVATGQFDAAEKFFRAAEPALEEARIESVNTSDQALCLKKLAWIRSRYLRKEDQAKIDVEEAFRLNPTDQNLKTLRQRLTGQESRDLEGGPRS